ncbi:MAG: hypothetical protein PWR11_603 [Bacillota bacterium]|nr:hypothetical protein [Bacillota bacterium]
MEADLELSKEKVISLAKKKKQVWRKAAAPEAGSVRRATPQAPPGGPARRTGRLAGTVVAGAIYWLVYTGVLGLLLVPPFFRGLFFPREQLIALLITLGLFILWWGRRFWLRAGGFFHGPVDLAALTLVVAYGLSFFVAANPRAALGELLKNMNYFLLLWLALELVRERRDLGLFLRALVLAGVATAVLGVGVAAGTFTYNGAFVGGRLASSFQYPNTFASYLATMMVLAVALAAETPRLWEKPLLSAAAGFMFLTFLFTQSRGALLILPAAALLLLVAAPLGRRLEVFWHLVAAATGALTSASPFGAALAAKGGGGVLLWQWAALAAGLAAALSLLALPIRRVSSGPYRRAAAVGLIVILVAMLGLAVVKIGPAKLLPGSLIARFRTISLTTQSAAERLWWSADAFRIVQDHPILGAGGGAWDALYHQYQYYLYWSNQVHNHWLQTWVEVGTVGFLAFLALWGAALYSALRVLILSRDCSLRLLTAGILAAAFNLGAHSFIDFNLSLSAVSFALWTLLALMQAAAEQGECLPSFSFARTSAAWPGALAVLLAGVTMAGAGSLLIGFNYGQQGAKFLQYNNIPFAIKRLEQAIKYDPLTASYQIDLAQCLEKTGEKKKDEKLILRALDLVRRGQELEPYNPTFAAIRAAMVFRHGFVDEGLKYAERVVELMPRRAADYESLAQAYVEAARYFKKKGETARAEEILAKLDALPGRIEELLAATPEKYRKLGRPPLSVTPRLNIYLGAGKYLAGEYNAAEAILTPLAESKDKNIQAEARLWLGLTAAKQGNTAEAQKLIEQALTARPELAAQLN